MTLRLKNSYMVPTRWDELDKDRFVPLCNAIGRFEDGKTDFDRFRLETVGAILGIDLGRIRHTDILTENLFRISEQLTFPYHIAEEKGRETVFLDIMPDRQMVPEVKGYRGYVFSVDAGMVDTDISAERYVDAISLMSLYGTNRNPAVLDKLFAVLYCGPDYNAAAVKAVRPGSVSLHQKIAVYYNFRGILEWIRRIPKYDLIFNHEDGIATRTSPMGIEGSLYSLAKSGYGSYDSICRLNVFTYLDLLLQQTIESVRQLKGCGLKPVEIAEKTNLSVEQITSVL